MSHYFKRVGIMKSFLTYFSPKEYIRKTMGVFAVAILFGFISSTLFSQVQIGTTSYSTLYDAFNAINNGTHTGAITVLITGNTTETSQAVLNPSGVGSASYSSITIRPSGGSRTITGSQLVPIINFNGASNVTLDGSVTDGGTTRDLTIENTGTDATNSGCIIATGSSYLTVKNIITKCYSRDYGVGITYSSVAHGTITNCQVTKANYGIFATNGCTYLLINKNWLGSTTSNDDKLRAQGIRFIRGSSTYSAEYFEILDNDINGLYNNQESSIVNVQRGILLGNPHNGVVYRNKIHNIYNDGTSSACYGVQISGYDTPSQDLNVTVANNLVYDLYSVGAYVSGIMPHSQSNVRYYHNVIYLTGTIGGMSNALYIHSDVSNIELKNNIIINNMTPGNSQSACALYFVPTTNPFSAIDYNVYNANSGGTNYIAYFSGYKTTVTEWQTAISGDANSNSSVPSFMSETDFHINGATLSSSDFSCPSIATDTYWNNLDIDSEARRTTTYRGVDEVIVTGMTLTKDIEQYLFPFCQGREISFSIGASATYGDGVNRSPVPAFAWYKNGTQIQNANGSSYVIPVSVGSDAGTYYGTATLAGVSVTSSNSMVDVHAPVTITKSPDALYYICAGIPLSEPPSVETRGTTMGYQWQRLAPSSTVWVDVAGQTSDRLNMSTEDPNQLLGYFRCAVTGGLCDAVPVYSDACQFTVSEKLSDVKITYNAGFDPANVCMGDDIYLKAEAKGTVLGYQWQMYQDGAWVNITYSQNSTSNDQTFIIYGSKTDNSGIYRCMVYGAANCNTGVIPTEGVTVTIWRTFDFARQPESDLLCYGNSKMLYVVADGDIYSYQWQKDGMDIDVEKNPSANTPILLLQNLTHESSGVYTCKLMIQDCRGYRAVSTKDALIYVLRETEIVNEPYSDGVKLGETATLEVKAHTEGAPTEYKATVQWYRGSSPLVDDEFISGAKSSILTIRDVKSSDIGDDYWVVVKGLCSSDTSYGFGVVSPGVQITGQTTSAYPCEGTELTMFVQAQPTNGGTSLKYQWFKNEDELLQNDARISGANATTITIKDVTADDSGNQYFVRVYALPGNDIYENSLMINVEVQQKVKINQDLQSGLTVQTGKELLLEIKAEGSGTLSYQWYKDGYAIKDGTSAQFDIPAVSAADAGVYYCIIKNNCNEILSNSCNVSVTNLTGVDDEQFSEESIVCQPNPFNEITKVKLQNLSVGNYKVVLTNALGQQIALLYNGEINNGSAQFDISASNYNLSSGTYYISVISGKETITKSIIVIR